MSPPPSAPPLTRRTFLRAAGTCIALPFLPSLHWRAFAAEPAVTQPKRLVFLTFGFGVTNETWFPDPKRTGSAFQLSPGLEPLQRHQRDITVVQGLTNHFNNEGHWGSTFYLTGANRYAVAGQSFNNTVSADQVAAEQLGRETRFASLQLGCANAESSGHGPGLSLAWNAAGKPVAGLDDPFRAYQRLFGGDDLPPERMQALLLQKRSALDAVRGNAASLVLRLNPADRAKLGEYLDSIREIEARLAKEAAWLHRPKPPAPFPAPAESLQGYEEIKMMYDLMIAAFQVDSTRVITYRQPVATLLRSLDVSVAVHDMSHYAPGVRMQASQLRDRKQSELLAYFLDRLKATRFADGTTLHEHVLLSYGSNIRTQHSLDNCPTILAGLGGHSAGIAPGRHVVLPARHTPLCNLWLTMLNAVGVPAKSHGDSTGPLRELSA